VVVRCRPFNKKEITEGRGNIIAIEPKTANIRITNALAADKQGRQGAGQENARDSKAFTFDAVYGEESTQKQFYEESCFSLVESVLEGFNGTWSAAAAAPPPSTTRSTTPSTATPPTLHCSSAAPTPRVH